MNYQPIDMHKKKSDALVIHCADPRFQAAYRSVIDELGTYYDLLVVPGASKAVVNDPSTIEYVKMLHDLHNFETVHILDHTECGAFGPIDNEVETHKAMLDTAASAITAELPELKIVPHLLSVAGEEDLA